MIKLVVVREGDESSCTVLTVETYYYRNTFIDNVMLLLTLGCFWLIMTPRWEEVVHDLFAIYVRSTR